MNQRERMLLLLLAGTPILLGVLFFAYIHLFVKPDYDRQIEVVNDQAEKKKREVFTTAQNHKKLLRWRGLSLPTDQHTAQLEYSRYLQDLLRGKVSDLALQPNTPIEVKGGTGPLNKKTLYTAVPFSMRGKVALPQLVQLIESFHRTPLMHKIKTLTLDRDENAGEDSRLTVQLTAEALIIDGAVHTPREVGGIDQRLVVLDALTALRRGPPGLALVPWVVSPRGPAGQQLALSAQPRKYEHIATRNIFTGAPAPRPVVVEAPDDYDITGVIQLSEIAQAENEKHEAFFYNRATARSQRLMTSTGYNTFEVRNESGTRTLVNGMILRIEPRDIFFVTDDGVFAMHIGQTLADALRRPLDDAEVQLLGLDVGGEP